VNLEFGLGHVPMAPTGAGSLGCAARCRSRIGRQLEVGEVEAG
jgi:hypothetical protein